GNWPDVVAKARAVLAEAGLPQQINYKESRFSMLSNSWTKVTCLCTISLVSGLSGAESSNSRCGRLTGSRSPGEAALSAALDSMQDAARRLVQQARDGLAGAQQFCSEEGACDQPLFDQLQLLASRANFLESVIPNPAAIPDAIQQLTPVMRSVCSAVGGDICNAIPAGASGAANFSTVAASNSQSAEPALISCRYWCNLRRQPCVAAANARANSCENIWNAMFRCWVITPYPDGQPFPEALRQEFINSPVCQQMVRDGRIPERRCTTCPQAERQGGCPQFFETGQSCGICTFNRCDSNPGQCSCARTGPTTASWPFT